MPVRDYQINYLGNNASLLAATLQLSAALRQLDANVTSVQAKIKNYASGSGASVNAAAKAAANLAAQLQSVSGAAGVAGARLSTINGHLGNISASAGGGSASLLSFGQAITGLAAARAVFGMILAETKQIEENWQRMAKEAIEFRDTLRELANIKGLTGPTTALYADVLKMANETAIAPEKARDALQAYENIGPTIRDLKHYMPGGKEGTEAETAALERNVVREAIRTGQRFGLDPGTAGAAIGSVGMFHTITSTEGAMSQFTTALEGLSKGKVSYTAGMGALNKAAAILVDPKEAEKAAAEDTDLGKIKPGRMPSFGAAGVYLGALSIGTGGTNQAGDAANRMIQISRTLNPDDPKKIAELEKMGINDQMDDAQKLIKLSEFFQTHKDLDPQKYLAERKIGSQRTREVTVAGMGVSKVLAERLADARRGMEQDEAGRTAMRQNQEFMRTDPTAIAATATTTKQIMDKVEGEQAREFEVAKELAEQRMRQNMPDYYSPLRRAISVQAISPITGLLYGVGGEGMHQETHEAYGAIPTLKRQAAKAGVDMHPFLMGLESGNPQRRAAAFAAASSAVRAKGFDPTESAPIRATTAQGVEHLTDVGGGARGAMVGGPGAAGGGGAGAGDGPIQQAQLKVLQNIERNQAANGGPAAMAPLGPAPLPGGPKRIGE
jgi:hypothetical protein